MRIGIFGTFDIGNFGDVLFPIVAEAMFKRIDPAIELQLFSYREKSAASWYYDVLPIQALPEHLGGMDLALIGGGHLIHGNRYMAKDYVPTDRAIPHPYGFWWLPVVAARQAGVPTAMHCVSVDPIFPDWSRPLLSRFSLDLDYANVRDVRSQSRMLSWAPDKTVDLVPDSIFSIGNILERGLLSKSAEAFLAAHGTLGTPYLIVQPSAALRHVTPFLSALIKDAAARGWRVLNLPIFSEGVEPEGYFAQEEGVTTVTEWPHPLLLAEIIANAHAVAGVSLHLSVVASTFGIPVFRPKYGSESKYILLDDLATIRFMDDVEPTLADIDGAFFVPPEITKWQSALSAHYEKLVAVAQKKRPEALLTDTAWADLLTLPDRLRAGRSLSDRVKETMLAARRSRNFLAMRWIPRFRKLVAATKSRS